jgi:hypothetical protein
MAGLRIIALAGAVTLAIAAGVAPALAGNDMCAALEARLALLNGGAGSLGNANLDLDRTILNQRLAYDRLNLAAQRSGCLDGPISQGRRLGQSCGPLLTTIRQMTANLIQLEAEQRRTSVNPFTAARDRASVLRQLAMNQCSGQYAAYGYPDMQRRPLVASLFGSSAVRNDFGPDGFDYFGQSNTYRTLCVRTCDGYYFPVSFSTVPEKFASDEQSCQSLCPGTPVALYVYRNPGADIDAMVSLDGRPYTALPTAFKFRKQFDAACSCHASATPATRFAPLPIPVKPSADAILTIPSGRPAEGNADAVARGASEAAGKDDPANDDSAPADKPVRIVGPSYYVAQ